MKNKTLQTSWFGPAALPLALTLAMMTLSSCGFPQANLNPRLGETNAEINSETDELANQSESDSNDSGADGVDSPNKGLTTLSHIDQPILTKAWLKEDGFATTSASVQTDGQIQAIDLSADLFYKATVKIPFGWVYSAASVAVRVGSPMACQFRGVEHESNPYVSYSRAELPCGRIVGGGNKQLVNLDIPAYAANSAGFSLKVDGFQTPILISRNQYSGNYQESRLDTRKLETMASSAAIGDDVSIRYEPREDGLGMKLHMCANLPGFDVTVPQKRITAKASGKVLFAKLSYATDFTVEFGNARFDYVRGCFATDVNFDGDSVVPNFKFAATEAPRVSNASYSGLKIRIESWWLRFFDNMLGWFRSSLKSKAVKLVNKEANKFADQELETGSWFVKANGQDVLDTVSEQANRSALKALRGSGLPLSGTEMRQIIGRQCDLLPLFKGVDFSFAEACHRALKSVKIAVLPFYRDPKMASLGCYDHYANIHQSTGSDGKWKWWAKDCGFALQLQLQIHIDLDEEAKKALDLTVSSINDLGSWLDIARDELGWKKDEETLLLFVFEEALKNGESLKSLSDLVRVAPNYRSVVDDRLRDWAGSAL